MKSVVLILIVSVCLMACQGNDRSAQLTQRKKDTTNYTTIKWIDSLKDIGTVPAGKTADINFRFVNTGDKPLFVIEAKPGCGCTLTDYPKEAILPGKEGAIKASYNVHKDGAGEFRKNIKVITNTKYKTDHFIFFYGQIKADSSAVAKPAK